MRYKEDQKASKSRWDLIANNNYMANSHLPLEFTFLEKVNQGFKTFGERLHFDVRFKIEVEMNITCVPLKIRNKMFKGGF